MTMTGAPIYEQPADLANEAAVAEILRVRWKFDELNKLPKLHPLDYVAIRCKTIAGFMEIKCRPGLTYNYGDGYYIAAKKIVAATNMRASLGVDTILAVRFPETPLVWWTRLRAPYRGIWAGRKDRPNDPFAMEEHAVIPWSAFEKVSS